MTQPPAPPQPSGDDADKPDPLAWPRYITPPQQPPAAPNAGPVRHDDGPPDPLTWPRYVAPPEQLPPAPVTPPQSPASPTPPPPTTGANSQPPPPPPSLEGGLSQPPPPTVNAVPQPPPSSSHSLIGGASQPPPPTANAVPQPPPGGTVGPQVSSGGVVTHTYNHELSRWGLGDVIASLGVYFAASIGIALTLVLLYGVDDFLLGPRLPIVVVGPHIALLAHAVWVSENKGQGLAADFKVQLKGIDVAWAIALFVGGLICAGVVGVVISQLLDEQPTSAAIEVARDSSGDTVTVWVIVFAVLVATVGPFVEEVVYRGLVWSALEKRGMNPGLILVVTSALFAAIHLEFVRSPILFVLGLALGMGRLLTGRIGAPILAHMIFNSLAMIATLAELS